MKKWLVLPLIGIQALALHAQYQITVTPIISGTATVAYGCKIQPTTAPAFAHRDLVTWVFPDGQYRQKEVKLDFQNVIVAGTDTVRWRPYFNPSTVPDNITAYVAKKGGTGNPSLIASSTSSDPWALTTSLPAPFYFPPGQNWQINRTWEFSPVDETFLVFSHKNMNLDNCAGMDTRFSLFLDPNQVDYMGSLAFNNEAIVSSTTSTGKTELEISGLSSNLAHNHVFLKLKSKTIRGELIRIDAVNHCVSSMDTIHFAFETAGGPHDPNRKTVNISKICYNQPAIKLTYSIQFHNDGDGPVENVRVTDVFAQELESTTFGNVAGPLPAWASIGIDDNTLFTRKITFYDLQLPGLNQTNPIYGYDQTTFRFTFDINTKPNFNLPFINNAEVFFYNDTVAFPFLYTNDEYVYTDSIDCYVSASGMPAPINHVVVAPNPFRDRSDITFNLAEKSRLTIDICDLDGRLVETIASGEYAAGPQHFTWENVAAPPGVYLMFLRSEKDYLARRMVKCR